MLLASLLTFRIEAALALVGFLGYFLVLRVREVRRLERERRRWLDAHLTYRKERK